MKRNVQAIPFRATRLPVGPAGPAGRCHFYARDADGWASRPYQHEQFVPSS